MKEDLSTRSSSPTWPLFFASFSALFLELLLIRWITSEIPILAYFKNFPLLSMFIGLGVGCLLADSKRNYWVASLSVLTGLCLVVCFLDSLGWRHIAFPDPHMDIWSLTTSMAGVFIYAKNLCIIFLILSCCGFSFLGLGQTIGRLIKSAPALQVYFVDICGGLAGVLAFGFMSALSTSPYLWIASLVLLLCVTSKLLRLRNWSLAPLFGLSMVALFLFFRVNEASSIVRWSPYYRIEVQPIFRDPATASVWYRLDVNEEIHQVMIDLSDREARSLADNKSVLAQWLAWRSQYDLPDNMLKSPDSVLIGGAGTGNDVAAALRNHAGRITAVEIDPLILDLGKKMHAEQPYRSNVVTVVNTDIRSFLRRSQDKFSLIVYSILDSHTALSSLSSLRLDNYVYTAEGLRDAYEHLNPQGIMCVSFFQADRHWLGERLYNTLLQATGRDPVCTVIGATIFFVVSPSMSAAELEDRLRQLKLSPDKTYAGTHTRYSSDDWPFLYSNPGGQPWVYYFCLTLIALSGSLLARWALRQGHADVPLTMDWQMFFLGAAFLLVETKALAEMALLFGSTWIVNAFVIAGIFVMILLANWVVLRSRANLIVPAYILLALSLTLWFFVPRVWLNQLSFTSRAVFGTGMVVVPLFFAGIVFSTAFATRKNTDIAFGSNLTGAVLGGALEALSLAWGIRALTLLAALLYVSSWACSRREPG